MYYYKLQYECAIPHPSPFSLERDETIYLWLDTQLKITPHIYKRIRSTTHYKFNLDTGLL